MSASLIVESSLPSRTTLPAVGRSRAARMLRSVVLPEPDSPMIATYSPFSTVKVTLESACTLFPPNLVVYTFCRLLTSKMDILFCSSVSRFLRFLGCFRIPPHAGCTPVRDALSPVVSPRRNLPPNKTPSHAAGAHPRAYIGHYTPCDGVKTSISVTIPRGHVTFL